MPDFTGSYQAGGAAAIRPFRCVTMDGTTDNTVEESDADEYPVGITTGDTKDYTSDNHADTAGDPVRLQTGKIQILEVGTAGVATPGLAISADADGRAEAWVAGARIGLSKHAGTVGERIEVIFHPETG